MVFTISVALKAFCYRVRTYPCVLDLRLCHFPDDMPGDALGRLFCVPSLAPGTSGGHGMQKPLGEAFKVAGRPTSNFMNCSALTGKSLRIRATVATA